MRSHASEFIDELCSSDVTLVVDLQFLVDLDLCLNGLLVVGIGKLELVLGAIIWDVIDEDNFVVVHASLLEIEIVDTPSRLISGEVVSEAFKVGIAARFITS